MCGIEKICLIKNKFGLMKVHKHNQGPDWYLACKFLCTIYFQVINIAYVSANFMSHAVLYIWLPTHMYGTILLFFYHRYCH